MRIGLIGAPESGKSKLGTKLSDVLGLPCIDNYAEELSDQTDIWIGQGSTYIPNLLVALERLKREFNTSTKDGRITCGTAVETISYCALHSSRVKEDSSPEEIDIDAVQAAVVMNAINLMMNDNWRYDFVFYLPNKVDRKGLRELDYAIREVLATLSIDYVTLGGEDQSAQAIESIWERQ